MVINKHMNKHKTNNKNNDDPKKEGEGIFRSVQGFKKEREAEIIYIYIIGSLQYEFD